jgi:hypothetical protein
LVSSQIEQDNEEYESLKSYFGYRRYSNIHRFYEDYLFHRSEKKFNKLKKLDISKCFDSIYTHSIAWAVHNKSIIKENIEISKGTFGGEFDVLMQKINGNETNGIIIGPEFSRIFAEIILQRVDENVRLELMKKRSNVPSLIHKRDYEIFRYVDDYFVFYNHESDLELVIEALDGHLRSYNLYLNDSKDEDYIKPILTNISLAKQKISDLFDDHLLLIQKESNDKYLRYSSDNVITRFKMIIKECDIDYKSVMNYSLAVLDRKISKDIKRWKSILEVEQEKKENEFKVAFLEILDVAFFLYSVEPRVNSTIKVCSIINHIICFLKKNKTNDYIEPFTIVGKRMVFKKIYDEIFLILQKNSNNAKVQIESLYLLVALCQLGREYRLSEEKLASYFGFHQHKNNDWTSSVRLNYFSLVVLLFYMKDCQKYTRLLKSVKIYITDYFNSQSNLEWKNNTENVLLLMDVLTCPYLNEDSSFQKGKVIDAKLRSSKNIKKYIFEEKKVKYSFKKKVLNSLNINDNHVPLIEAEKYWFVKWTDFDFGLAIQSKKSQEVY